MRKHDNSTFFVPIYYTRLGYTHNIIFHCTSLTTRRNFDLKKSLNCDKINFKLRSKLHRCACLCMYKQTVDPYYNLLSIPRYRYLSELSLSLRDRQSTTTLKLAIRETDTDRETQTQTQIQTQTETQTLQAHTQTETHDPEAT